MGKRCPNGVAKCRHIVICGHPAIAFQSSMEASWGQQWEGRQDPWELGAGWDEISALILSQGSIIPHPFKHPTVVLCARVQHECGVLPACCWLQSPAGCPFCGGQSCANLHATPTGCTAGQGAGAWEVPGRNFNPPNFVNFQMQICTLKLKFQ